MIKDMIACLSRMGAKGTLTRTIGNKILQYLVAGTKIALKRIDPT